jgi:glutamate 5-kinase
MKRPLVVKLGSSLVVAENGRPNVELVADVAAQLGALAKRGTPVCVVSSGAIALGAGKLGLSGRPGSLPSLQAASALGQAALQRTWQDAFAAVGLEAAQVLLTGFDIAERRSYLNVRNALDALLAAGAVPILNENDVTATEEITFGDNDVLAAQCAVLVRARQLILLTEADGVLEAPGAAVIADGADARRAVPGAPSLRGRGGIESKISAAELAARPVLDPAFT